MLSQNRKNIFQNKIKKDIYKYEKDEDIRKMLLEGIPNVSIRKNTEPESGFFAVMDFTKLKGKKYNDKVIEIISFVDLNEMLTRYKVQGVCVNLCHQLLESQYDK